MCYFSDFIKITQKGVIITKMINEVMEYLPKQIKEETYKFIKEKSENEELIEEIRLRTNKNLTIKIGQELIQLKHQISKQELTEAFENICEKSIYAYTKQISEGFITIKGGNRVGITGSCVIENGQVINMNYISSLNFRIARQIKEVSVPILKYVIDIQNDTIFNTLIVSPPGVRKNNYFKRLSKKNIQSEFQK